LGDFQQEPLYTAVEVLPLNLRGWYRHAKFKEILAKKDIKTVVEVGVWLGNCTIYLAEMLPENGKIFAVDHWLGSEEHRDPNNYGEYKLLPTLYQQFLSNVIHYNLMDRIIPVRLSSLQAAKKFRELNIRPDLIYIDAGHDYKSVLKDIEAWFPLLEEGGMLCGDDWNLGNILLPLERPKMQTNLKPH
jgi:predicted O-methyltransferase YrrM